METKPLSRSEREAKIKDKAGFVIVFLAALLAINTLFGGQNSSVVMNNTISANNQWSWYQAKNIRQVLYETAALQAQDKQVKQELSKEADRMEHDKQQIMEKAIILEAQRDAARKKSPWFTWGGSILQISIVLLTASILAVSMPMFWISIIIGSIGGLFVTQAMWMWL